MDSDGNPRNLLKKVLVLNTSFVPINICSWKRAIILLFKEKADPMDESHVKINNKYKLPQVIKLRRYVPMPYTHIVLTRKNVYLRDNYICQYCGKSRASLTIDHIIPKSKGGSDDWENIVVCCMRCNNRKGDKTPEESGMKLISTPYKPPSSLYLQVTRFGGAPQSWYNYFFNIPGRN